MRVFVNGRQTPKAVLEELGAAFGPRSLVDSPKTIRQLRADGGGDGVVIRYRSGRFFVYFTSGPPNAFVHSSVESIRHHLVG
jgi:hypothetical protein